MAKIWPPKTLLLVLSRRVYNKIEVFFLAAKVELKAIIKALFFPRNKIQNFP
jgi:hypothetical protein